MAPYLFLALLVPIGVLGQYNECIPTVTQVSGTFAPESYCSGDLIFEDNFDSLNTDVWRRENTLAGGGNWEFQWYTVNASQSFTGDGILYIRPSLLADQFGEEFLSSGTIDLGDECTQSSFFGCNRTGTTTNFLNPIKSSKLTSVESFSFAYGRIEFRAKMPSGDWLWPAIWMMPVEAVYGGWPLSGEIDLVESRGNRQLIDNSDQVNIGTEQVASTLHFGPESALDKWNLTQWKRNDAVGYDAEFHRYQLEWSPDYMKFSIDDLELGTVTPPKGGFWEFGDFSSSNLTNLWVNGTKMAPFDQKFYFIINLACGGTTGFFSDAVTNPSLKPWLNNSTRATTDLWGAKDEWLPTWHLDENEGHNASLQVDYLRVWAL